MTYRQSKKPQKRTQRLQFRFLPRSGLFFSLPSTDIELSVTPQTTYMQYDSVYHYIIFLQDFYSDVLLLFLF